ncbi:MAG: trypsin-like peptidase domain-containing protein [Opitutus sp.]|nr:trypsin-like peptidase domain-containing protein [Opitutus sp.]MCS6246968.1 trypsin-like peptidase domain-containing protein [Opitutus sp.]MCS6272774.1 trypsin-like peptidase domain-containing protein [Opitutus sp.]MCS6301946.1 trypsin-like peptidase domain-containing protein [Opitutus sp.]
MQIKVRRPNAYWLSIQSAFEGGSAMSESSASTLGQSQGWSVYARQDNGTASRGYYEGPRFATQPLGNEPFMLMVSTRMGGRVDMDLVLRHFQVRPAGAGGLKPLGLIEPELIGSELLNGRSVYRIFAKTAAGSPILLWVEQSSFLIVRSIMQYASPSMSNRQVIVEENFYNRQQLNPSFTASDFTVEKSPPPEPLSAEQMGFISIPALIKLAELTPPADGTHSGESANSVPPTPASPGVAAVASPTPAGTGQSLSYQQMSSIVLVEGEGGAATGFMTKIRGVDFIVTNLHVLSGSKKITIKNLNGQEQATAGIFGAVGSDIAIIRTASGTQGEMVLAQDVFASSQIGDRVVVVGNRLGGGVATQTVGSIMGIGPTRVEVNANFEPGNSGSPIFNLRTNEVVGVATYAEIRPVDAGGGGRGSVAVPEKRWFGYRIDSVAKWEAIDLGKWNAQGERIAKFREASKALLAIVKFDFKTARLTPPFGQLIDKLESNYQAAATNKIVATGIVKDFFRVVQSISAQGLKDLESGDYYDYYRTSLYWDTSIPAQIEFRKELIKSLERYEADSSAYISRMRSGG